MENKSPLKPKHARNESHLMGFAKSHFAISGIGLVLVILLFTLSSHIPYFFVFILIEMILLAMYAFAGIRCAKKEPWALPHSVKAGIWEFLKPALIAWGWAALVIISMLIGSWDLFGIFFLGSLLFAAPSFLMVYIALLFGCFDGELLPALCLWGVLAGGIPPLLFTLGSLWGSRNNKVKTDENESTDVKERDADV